MLKLLSNKKLQKYIASFLFIINLFLILPSYSYANKDRAIKTKENLEIVEKEIEDNISNNLEEDNSEDFDKINILSYISKVDNINFIENIPDYMYNVVIDKAHKDILNILENEANQEKIEEAIIEILKKGVEDYKKNEQEKLNFIKEKERRDASIVSKNRTRNFISPSPRVNSEIRLLDSFDGNKELGRVQATAGFVAVSDINRVVRNYSVDFTKHEIDTFIDVRNTGGVIYLIPDYVEFDVEYVIPFQLDINKKLAIPEKKTYHRKALIKHNMKTPTDVFKGEGFDRYIGAPSSMSNSRLDLDRILNETSWKSLELEDGFFSNSTGVLENSNFTIDDLKNKNKRKVKIEIETTNINRSNISVNLVDKTTDAILGTIHLRQPFFSTDSDNNLIGEEIELILNMDNGHKDIMTINEDSNLIDRAVNILSNGKHIGRRFYLNKDNARLEEFKVKGNEENSIILKNQSFNLEVKVTEKGKDLFYPKIIFYDYQTGEILDYFDTEPYPGVVGMQTASRIKEGQITYLTKDWKTVFSSDDKFFKGDPEFSISDSSFDVNDIVYSRTDLYITPLRSRAKKIPLVPKDPSNMKKYRIKTYSNDVSHRDLAFRPVGAKNQSAKDKVNAYFDYEIRRPANETEHKVLALNMFDPDFIENNKGLDIVINEHFSLRSTRTFGSVASTLEDVNYDDSVTLSKNSKYVTIKPGNKKEIKIFATGKKLSDVFDRYYVVSDNLKNGIKERHNPFTRQTRIERSDERLYTPGIVLQTRNLEGEEIYDHEILFVHDKEKDKELYKDGKITGQHFHVSSMGSTPKGLRGKYSPAFYVYTRDGKYTDFIVEIYNNKTGKLLERVNIDSVSHDLINPTLKSTAMGYRLGYKFSHHDYPNKDFSDISSSGDKAVVKSYYDPNRLMIKLEHFDTIQNKVIGEEYFLANVGDVYTPKEVEYDKARLERDKTIVIPPKDETDIRQVVRFDYTPKEDDFEILYVDLDDNNKVVKRSTFKGRYYNPVGDIEIETIKNYNIVNVKKPSKLLNKDDKVIVELERGYIVYEIVALDIDNGEVIYRHRFRQKKGEGFEYYPQDVYGYDKLYASPIFVEEGSSTSFLDSYVYNISYTRKRYNIEVDYLTEDGNKIKDSETYELMHGDKFNVKAKDLPLVSNPSPKEFNISEVKDNTNLEFIYEAQDVDIKINYIDQDGRLVKTDDFKRKAYNSFSRNISNVAGLDKYELANKDKTDIYIDRLDKPSYNFNVDVLLKSFDLIIEGVNGSKYRIYDKDNDKEIILEVGENGKIVKNLPISNYKIEQIYAPENYRINNKIENITVKDINNSYGSITLKYEQHEANSIPETGTWAKLPFYILGILLGTISVVLKRKETVK